MNKTQNYRVCVIGAGVAGLSSARYLKQEGISFTVLECTQYVGGTWRYDPRVGYDENGLLLHTSMYKHLRTNLPKPTMELNGFRLPKDLPSYPSGELYCDYLNSFTKYFDLEKHIRFLHQVVSITRLENTWNVKHKHVVTGEEFEEDYEYVIVGTGHHSKPHRPVIPGEDLFEGTIIHSHDYRVPDPYAKRRVLTIGAGPSGKDISLFIAEVAIRLLHSHHSQSPTSTPFPDHYVNKPDVKEFRKNGVVFVDGSFEEVDDVIYCTGYDFNYPFLDGSCGLAISTDSVTPLYKHVVNINEPTMLIVGLVVKACVVTAIDAQARYAVALIKGAFTLPSKEVMMAEWRAHAESLREEGRPLSHLHHLGDKEDEYYAELTKESGISRVPPVVSKIRNYDDIRAKPHNLYTYRNYEYIVVDDNKFTRRLEDKILA
ncbi:senecionine N-oxygenase-like [Choristoneura fumiferana]|uniref:senecionine N-oxygenase-like n=1 Tax=Choristoneura fumiferana TaxID=7141 RepID=UPI003D15EA46